MVSARIVARNITEDDAKLLRSLEQHGLLKYVVEFFERRQRQVDLALRRIAPDLFPTMQGRAQELEDLVTVFTTDRKVPRG